MALTQCKECQKPVSTEASSCPHCGAAVKRKSIGFGTGIVLLFVVGFLAMKIDTSLRSNNSSAASLPVAAPAKTVNPYCGNKKKNGTIDSRTCDLSELCKDWAFFKKKALESNAKGDKSATYDAQKSFAAVNINLSEYKDEDVSACLASNGR